MTTTPRAKAAAWHHLQHAIFARPRDCPLPPPGTIGAVLTGLRAALYPDGHSPYLPVPARGQPCRFCTEATPMTTITFHTPAGAAQVAGSERHHAHLLIHRLTHAAMAPQHLRERYRALVPPKAHLDIIKPEGWARMFSNWWQTWGAPDDLPLTVPGVGTLSPWDLSLNTAIVLGSDPLELMARVHGTCELHGWVDGEHRAFLADVVAMGLADKLLRHGQGWEAVLQLLEDSDSTPVVMSYSGSAGFPDPNLAGFPIDPEETPDQWVARWEALPVDDQWQACMAALRAAAALTGPVPLQIDPEEWGLDRFGCPGWSVLELEAWLDERPHLWMPAAEGGP